MLYDGFVVERKRQPLESLQSQLVVETQRYADLFTPSPLEVAFDTEIQRRFKTALFEPYVGKYGDLIRVSYPVIAGDCLVEFQYTRQDLLRGDPEDVIKLLLPHNPSIRATIGDIEYPGDGEGYSDACRKLEIAMELEEKFIEAIKRRITEKDGAIDPHRALSDPAYYTEGDQLEQWPESFEFVVFHSDNQFGHTVQPTELGHYGKLDGRRPDVYGNLWIDPCFKEIKYRQTYRTGSLQMYYPRIYYDIAKAYGVAFAPETFEIAQKENIAADRVGWFQQHIRLTHPIHMVDNPQKLMEKIGIMVDGLCHVSHQQ